MEFHIFTDIVAYNAYTAVKQNSASTRCYLPLRLSPFTVVSSSEHPYIVSVFGTHYRRLFGAAAVVSGLECYYSLACSHVRGR